MRLGVVVDRVVEAARAMGHALRWDVPPDATDLAHDLFAQYTLVERPSQ